jgi:hypothetical protein
LGTGQKFFNDFSELVWISIYAKSLKSLANLAETVQTDPGSRPLGRRTWPGDSLWAFFCCLDAQNGLTFTGTARQRFSPLSVGSSVLDALWIVAIILEQPAYALIVPSRPIRFWLLILLLQVLPGIKTQTTTTL